MKNINSILIGILFILVIVLFYLHFSSITEPAQSENITTKNSETKISFKPDTLKNLSGVGRIVYINTDSLQAKYKLHEELTKKLEKRKNQYEKEVESKLKSFEKEIELFQKEAQYLTQEQGMKKQTELAQKEQDLYKLREDLTIKFAEEESKLNEKLLKSVFDYLEEYAKDKPIDLILGYSSVSNILYGNPDLDITNEIVDELNKRYDASKSDK
jgi:outer membrane protein